MKDEAIKLVQDFGPVFGSQEQAEKFVDSMAGALSRYVMEKRKELPSQKLRRQLSENGQLRTLAGCPLSLKRLIQEIYQVGRYRSMERPVAAIDCYTSEQVQRVLREAMVEHCQNRYGVTAERVAVIDVGYDQYNLPELGTTLAVFAKGRRDHDLWFLDISDTTEQWDILTPQRHLLIENFNGFTP